MRRRPKPSRDCDRDAFLCEDVLAAEGVTDFDRYAYQPGAEPQADLFVDHALIVTASFLGRADAVR